MRLLVGFLTASLFILLLGLLAQRPVDAGLQTDTVTVPCAGNTVDAMPQDAYFLPVRQASNLQRALDSHKIVKLEAFGDYTKYGGPETLTLSSGQELYGLLETKIGRVKVTGGSSGIILQGVSTDGVDFLRSNEITRANCFRRISGKITIKEAKLEDNLFVDLSNSPLDIDTRNGGYLRNNRFIRVVVHGTSPALLMRGDSGRNSGNNVFLWFNVLTPHGDGIIIDNQDNVSFVGLDAESWNWSKRAKLAAMMTVRSTGSLKVMAANGGDPKSRSGRYFDIDAEDFQIMGSHIGPVGHPALTLQPELRRMVSVNVEKLSTRFHTNRYLLLNTFGGVTTATAITGNNSSEISMDESKVSDLRNMLIGAQHYGQPWESTVLSSIPDPAGSGWNLDLENKPDSSDYIQGLIDSKRIAHLPAGIFYVSKPIRVGDRQGVVGAGASRTAIIAKNRKMDIIVGAQHISKPSTTRFVLADITLQGGRNGILHNAVGAGPGAQFNRMVISHVTFRDMSESGILIDGVLAWDNNFIDNTNFFRCAQAGIKQRVGRHWLPGSKPGMSFMDKNVFYRCQFVENGRGIDFEAKRANNLNAFVGCVFRDNSEFAANMTNNNSTVFADTRFINNGGDPIVKSNKPTYFVNAHFRADRNHVAMLPNNAFCEGCAFELGLSKAASIVSGKERVYLLNSRSKDMTVGTPDSGVLINSILPGNSALRQLAVSVNKGDPHTIISGEARPMPQLLIRDIVSK